jgi:hypothetical protein
MPTLDPQLLSGELSHCGAPNGLGTASREPEGGDQSSSTIAERTRQGATSQKVKHECAGTSSVNLFQLRHKACKSTARTVPAEVGAYTFQSDDVLVTQPVNDNETRALRGRS